MAKLFSFNSPLYRFLSRIADLVTINLLWTVCSLPVITAGASTTAMYACMRRLHTDTGHIIPNFFKAFRDEFRTATLFWLGVLAVSAALLWNFYLLGSWDFSGKTLLFILTVQIALLLAAAVTWFFPLLAGFKNGLRTTFVNSVAMALGNPVSTLEMLLFNLVPFALLLFRTDWFMWSLIFWTFIGSAVIAQLNSIIFRAVCEKRLKPEKNSGNEHRPRS